MNMLARSLKKVFTQPDFVVVFVLLGVSAATLNFATDFLKLHYRKMPVALRTELDDKKGIPSRLGAWVQVGRDASLAPDVEHVLGTHQFINRRYVNSEAAQAAGIDLNDPLPDPTEEQLAAIGRLQMNNPGSVLELGIYYYTGLVDTVAHIPDRCLIGNGYDITSYQTQSGENLGTFPDGSQRVLNFRYIHFDDNSTARSRLNVAYLFHVNGTYESDPYAVRARLQNLFERFGYYAKVEIMVPTPASVSDAGTDPALPAIRQFLTAVLPEFERCLPDWKQVHVTAPK